jgi:hypothetical protein
MAHEGETAGGGGVGDKLFNEPGLSHSRFAGEEQHLSGGLARARDKAAQERELAVAPYQGHPAQRTVSGTHLNERIWRARGYPANIQRPHEDFMVRLLLIASLSASSSAAAQAPAPPKPPEIFFRSPANGATVTETFPVVFGLRNYGVAPAGLKVDNTGHFHVIINKEAPAVGEIIPPNDSVYRHFGTGAIEATLTLPPGTYTLRAVLGDFEHRVISAPLISRPIRITVRN